MKKEKYNWTYGENDCQNYYEVKLGKDYLELLEGKSYEKLRGFGEQVC